MVSIILVFREKGSGAIRRKPKVGQGVGKGVVDTPIVKVVQRFRIPKKEKKQDDTSPKSSLESGFQNC